MYPGRKFQITHGIFEGRFEDKRKFILKRRFFFSHKQNTRWTIRSQMNQIRRLVLFRKKVLPEFFQPLRNKPIRAWSEVLQVYTGSILSLLLAWWSEFASQLPMPTE